MEAMRKLNFVEQEGVGVDRMVADLIRIGSKPPLIELTDRPAVRVVLAGQSVDERRYRFFEALQPPSARDDVDAALIVWVSSRRIRPAVDQASTTDIRTLRATDAAREPLLAR